MDSGAFTETLEAVDADVAAALYGVDAADITDCAVYTSLSAGAEEIAVLVMADETSATAAMDGLEKRVPTRRPPWRATSPTRWPSWTAPSSSSGAAPCCWRCAPTPTRPGPPSTACRRNPDYPPKVPASAGTFFDPPGNFFPGCRVSDTEQEGAPRPWSRPSTSS